MKLSQLIAEATARLADIRAKHGQEADAKCTVSWKHRGLEDFKDLQAVEAFKDAGNGKHYFELKTEKEREE